MLAERTPRLPGLMHLAGGHKVGQVRTAVINGLQRDVEAGLNVVAGTSSTSCWGSCPTTSGPEAACGTLADAVLTAPAPPGDALLVHGTLPPAHLRSRPYYASRRLRALAAGHKLGGEA